MSKKQRKILAVAALVCAGMILFPPFNRVGFSGQVWGSDGYHFVGAAPSRSQINFGALVWQLVALGVATSGILYAAKD